ncbi:hypothetical protein HN51_062714 [Arachis hypogaea]
MKTIKGATTGLIFGTIWGTVVATWNNVPHVERNVAFPGLAPSSLLVPSSLPFPTQSSLSLVTNSAGML